MKAHHNLSPDLKLFLENKKYSSEATQSSRNHFVFNPSDSEHSHSSQSKLREPSVQTQNRSLKNQSFDNSPNARRSVSPKILENQLVTSEKSLQFKGNRKFTRMKNSVNEDLKGVMLEEAKKGPLPNPVTTLPLKKAPV